MTTIMTRKKNAFVSKELGGVMNAFRVKIESNIAALRAGDVENADLVRVNPRSGEFEATIGEGKNNWGVANSWIGVGEVGVFNTTDEIADFFENDVLVAFNDGELDEGLRSNFQKRKDAGKNMRALAIEKALAEQQSEKLSLVAANG